jgi:hypothetical protein
MEDYYFVTVDGRPLAKSNMYGVRVVGTGKKAKGIIYTTRELEEYELMIGRIVSNVIPKTIETYTSIYLRVYQHGKRWIDIDNCFKAIGDGVDNSKTIKRGNDKIQVCETGIKNDKLFQLLIGERIHVESKEDERVELIIAEYKGIIHFTNLISEHYDLDSDYFLNLFLPNLNEK